MPIAVITNPSQRFDLLSCPPDGYVVIRRMTYGEKLQRQSMLTKFRMEMSTKKDESSSMDIDLDQKKVTLWEFANLIVEHNLTDENEKLLNFKNIVDIQRLGPVVGEEIQNRIDELNSFEESEYVKN